MPDTGSTIAAVVASTVDPAAVQQQEEDQAASSEQTTPADEPEPELEFFMDPYLVPVGSDGWALHIYSFPDEAGAEEQLEILQRKGFMTETRAVQIKGKGRWQRIYLGSFLSRASAQQALAPLLKELREDWGRPTEF